MVHLDLFDSNRPLRRRVVLRQWAMAAADVASTNLRTLRNEPTHEAQLTID